MYVTEQTESHQPHLLIHLQYFGTMAGVRNFGDPNVQVNEGISVWKQ